MKTKKFMTTALATFTAISTLAIGTYLSQTSFVSAVSETPSSSSSSTSTTVSTTTAKTTETHEYEWETEYGKRYLKIDGKRATGWKQYKGKNYFFNLDGSARIGLLETKETH